MSCGYKGSNPSHTEKVAPRPMLVVINQCPLQLDNPGPCKTLL